MPFEPEKFVKTKIIESHTLKVRYSLYPEGNNTLHFDRILHKSMWAK